MEPAAVLVGALEVEIGGKGSIRTMRAAPSLRLSRREFRSGTAGRGLSEKTQRKGGDGLVTTPVRLGRAAGKGANGLGEEARGWPS